MHSEWIIQIHDQIYLTPKLVSSSHRTLLHTTLYHFLNEWNHLCLISPCCIKTPNSHSFNRLLIYFITQLCQSHLTAIPWTVATQAPLSMSHRQEHWSGLPFFLLHKISWPRDRAQGSCTAGRFFTIWAMREALLPITRQYTTFKKIRDQGNISHKDGLSKGQKWYRPNSSRKY